MKGKSFMSDLESARNMFRKALSDFKALSGMLDSDIFSEEIFGFHAQQAVEKALKAWITQIGIKYPYSHDIAALLTILKDHGEDVDKLWDLVEFNIYAIQFRYPGEEYQDEKIDRIETIESVSQIVNLVKDKIQTSNQ